jgi:hypothetical protein
MAVEELMTVDSTSPLAFDPEEIRHLGYRAVDLAVEHLTQRRSANPRAPWTATRWRAESRRAVALLYRDYECVA